ncbi:hypothetical protein [uncultured Ruthenibacterium sp.]|uniref:hypothetical protein n=1 Tax=uncultured Ruthenibacterium sp. TaxID=1905347 RepID=UPI00349E5C0E
MGAFFAKCEEIWNMVWKILRRQELEAPEFFDGMITIALRLCLIALVGLAVVLMVTLILELIRRKCNKDPKKKKVFFRRSVSLACALAVVLGLCVWAYWPTPLAESDQVESITLSSRVPGKKEKPVTLTTDQTQKLVELLQNTVCIPSWRRELPYAGYGQTFRITLTTESGVVRILAAPDTGCVYTQTDEGLIYSIAGYGSFYEALSAL